MMTVLPDRIARLRDEAVRRGGSFACAYPPCLDDAALWRAWEPGMSVVQVRAAMLREIAAIAPVEIGPDERIVGLHLRPLNAGWLGRGDLADADYAARLGELGVPADQADDATRKAARWLSRTDLPSEIGVAADDSHLGRGAWEGNGQDVFWAFGWMENHSIRDYPKAVRIGFGGLRDEILSARAGARLADPDFPQRDNFWRAALDVCEAACILGRRYAAEARRLAASATDPADRLRLEAIAGRCDRVPERGARTLGEAVQGFWFAHLVTCGEDGINANSIGHLDHFLLPAYQADLHAARAAGRPESEVSDEADEWLAELGCRMYLDYDVQAITLGGCDAEGKNAANPLSMKILETTRALGTIRDISLRVRKDTPDDLLRLAAEMVVAGGGVPFFFNDDAFLPALVSHGVPASDAWDYAPLGCVELTIPGKGNMHAVSGYFNIAKCVELALFDGVDPRTGKRLGPATGRLGDHPDFESFWNAYDAQVRHFAARMAYHCNRGELLQRAFGPQPCWSVLCDDCIARGRDVTDGGARYFNHSISLLGTANAADSMMVLQKLVFEEKSLDLDELLDALQTNFEGREELRQRLLHSVPKYGNGDAEVDALACRVDDHFIDLMDSFRSPQGGRYWVHLFSYLCNLPFGRSLGATPDGRKAGEPIAYSLSAQQGRDEKGVTAFLRSLATMPHRRAAGGSAAIVDLDPTVVAGEQGPDRLVAILRSAFDMGVGQLQINVVTAERLLQAQADPEHFGDIPVRVAGYSQKFKLVERSLQDHIIARTKHHL
ncbi:MAG: pyruvate formate lyase family protein [Kiritimatiellia bacterium]|jgi:pyruvate-formate lyase